MIAFSPAIYAHSFFNTKDIPALSMFLICFTLCQAAFENKKAIIFLLLGIACGYSTGIRVMGVMLDTFVLLFLLIDLVTNRAEVKKTIINTLLFLAGCCVTLYISWPYLWEHPFVNFISAYHKMAHFVWDSSVFLNGKMEMSQHLPRRYFPIWFTITNPVLWLITGFAGIVWAIIDICRKPLAFIRNTNERNFLLYLGCFAAPIFVVMFLHAVIYDGWRHLYFIYPSFMLMAIYFIHKLWQKKYKYIVMACCLAQACFISFFMISNHPEQQVYFNSLIPHSKEYIRKHYEFDYWGVSYLQALEYLVRAQPYGKIKLCFGPGAQPLRNNILMLQERDRTRIELSECDQADYFMTAFRGHPDDFPDPVEYSIVVLNSTVVCVYKVAH
jgi:hypothetical protein